MDYIALYRKYRPKFFTEVIGQDSIVKILKNQIVMNKIAHAYLFSGTRGTGKTSAAKIFAKSVNCPNNHEGEPCDECDVCKDIDQNQVMDIIEIDAASNRGVDEIRDLREKVKYPPTIGIYKVYIIDEVHMLTQEAFNALLKTLEEPPKNVIFILATTEPHKLPATILSRCQRFNFKRIEINEIVARMRYICDRQGIQVEENTLLLIAKNSDGAMRDALSILEQCLSLGVDGSIHYEQVKELLGLSQDMIIYQLAEKVIKMDVESAVKIVENAYENGTEMSQLMNQLIICFRDILIHQISKDLKKQYDVSLDHEEWLKELSNDVHKDRLTYIIETLTEMDNKMKYSTLPKIIMEITIIKLCQTTETVYKVKEKQITTQSNLNTGRVNNQIPEKRQQDNSSKIAQKDISVGDSKIDINSICRSISKDKPMLASSLKMGTIKGVKNNVLTIQFKENDSIHLSSSKKNQKFIEETINKVFKMDYKLNFLLEENDEDDFIQMTKTLFGDEKVSIIED